MAFGNPYNIGTIGTKNSTTEVITTVVTVPVVDTIFVVIYTASANAVTVTDTNNNTYTLVNQFNAPGGSGQLFASWGSEGLVSGGRITATGTSLYAASAFACSGVFEQHYIYGRSNQTTGSGTTPSITVGGTLPPLDAAATYLAVGVVVIQGPNGDTFTQATNFAIPPNAIGSTGGSQTSNYSLRGGWRKFTGLTQVTYNPTLGTSRAWGIFLIAFRQDVTLYAYESDDTSPIAVSTIPNYSNFVSYYSDFFRVTNVNAWAQTFIAPSTGRLGNIRLPVNQFSNGATPINPTTIGEIELWQLSVNNIDAPPSTLIGSLAFNYFTPVTVSGTNAAPTVDFDLSLQSWANVTAGVGYAIILVGGSDWGATDRYGWTISVPTGGSLLTKDIISKSLTNSSFPNTATWVNANAYPKIFVGYDSSTADVSTGIIAPTGSITETTTSVDFQDAVYTANAFDTETGNADDSSTGETAGIGVVVTESVTSTDLENASSVIIATELEAVSSSDSVFSNNIIMVFDTESVSAIDIQIGSNTTSAQDFELISSTDNVTSVTLTNSAITESIIGLDSSTVLLTANVTDIELLNAQDFGQVTLTTFADIIEYHPVSDSVVALTSGIQYVFEFVSADEVQDADHVNVVYVNEDITAQDNQNSSITFSVEEAENVNATESADFSRFVNSEITESVNATDSIVVIAIIAVIASSFFFFF